MKYVYLMRGEQTRVVLTTEIYLRIGVYVSLCECVFAHVLYLCMNSHVFGYVPYRT